MLIKCDTCGKEFDRIQSEVNRSKRLGRKNYCSRSCCGKDNVFKSEKRIAVMGNADFLRKGSDPDEFSPFRLLWRTARRHAQEKGRDFTISLEDMKNQWEKQSGVCSYTGWEMELPRTSQGTKKSHRKASIDRIDSSKGYTPDNIQFVSYMANCAKNEFSEDKLIAFCEAVVHNKSR